jgi:hypothetical protein
MLRAVALTFTCAVMAITAVACGQSASGGDANPASLVPADAGLYLEAAVRPEGDRRGNALAAAGKVLRTDDPAGRLEQLFDDALANEGEDFTWARDFAPWVGEEAGMTVSDLEAAEPSFAFVLTTTDAEAAKAAIEKAARSGETTYSKRSYDGIDYQVDDDGTAVGLIDDFVVIATEKAFKRTADVRDGGKTLADSDRYKSAIDDLADDRLGLMFVDMKTLIDASLAKDPESAAQFEQVKQFLPLDKLGPTVASLQADGDAIVVDSATTGVPEGPFRTLIELTSGAKTELMADLPGDAWGAFALPKLGETAKTMFSSFAGAIGGAAAAAEVKRSTGLDLEQDIFSWIGDAGLFVRGATEQELDGALVIQSTDDAKASAAFGKIIGLIGKEAGARPDPIQLEGAESAFSLTTPGAEKPIVLARGEGRVVAAYGEEAAKAALDPATQLGDSELYGDAKAALEDGMEPGFLLSMPAVLELIDAVGETDADYDKVKPYLETLNAITSAGKVDGDTAKSRIAVTLK